MPLGAVLEASMEAHLDQCCHAHPRIAALSSMHVSTGLLSLLQIFQEGPQKPGLPGCEAKKTYLRASLHRSPQG